jgi:hypothetical protein
MTTVSYTSTAAAIAWAPSADRRVVLPGVSAAGRRGVSASSIIALPQKPLGTQWECSIDLAAQIAQGDTVSSVDIVGVTPAGLAVLYAGGWGKLIVLWLSPGGNPGQTYAIDLVANTVQGRQIALIAAVTVPTVAAGASPAVITVVQVPTSYVDAAVAPVQASANQALASASAALAQASQALAAATYQPGIDYTNTASLGL